MTYSIIQPPFSLQFREMSKKDLLAYATRFHGIAPARIAELTKAITSTPGYEAWEADASPESLDDLGRWFEGRVETRKKDDAELAEQQGKLTFPIDIPEWQLTNRTFSLAMDIGMYFAQVVLKNVTGTHWDQLFGGKKFAHYGQPVIMGFGAVPLNPVHVIVTKAYSVTRKKPAQLRGLYDTWAQMKR